jgi:hypothetical protein
MIKLGDKILGQMELFKYLACDVIYRYDMCKMKHSKQLWYN